MGIGMTFTITPDAFAKVAQALRHDESRFPPLKPAAEAALPLVNSAFTVMQSGEFHWDDDIHAQHWGMMVPPGKTDPSVFPSIVDQRSMGVDIDCDAGLVSFYVETESEGTSRNSSYRTTVVAKTESSWDRFKRWIGWERDVTITPYDEMYIDTPQGFTMAFGVQLVVGLSALPAAADLYGKLCR